MYSTTSYAATVVRGKGSASAQERSLRGENACTSLPLAHPIERELHEEESPRVVEVQAAIRYRPIPVAESRTAAAAAAASWLHRALSYWVGPGGLTLPFHGSVQFMSAINLVLFLFTGRAGCLLVFCLLPKRLAFTEHVAVAGAATRRRVPFG